MDQLEEQIHFLILNPINDERIAGKINELSEKNIPVITVNTDIEGSRRLCYVGCDYLKSGRTACGILGIATDGKGRVGIATGSVKILGHNQRIRGFYETQKKRFPELNILDIVETEDDKATGYTPVSYTHLDVYKRQGQCGEGIGTGRLHRCGEGLYFIPEAAGKDPEYEVHDPGL